MLNRAKNAAKHLLNQKGASEIVQSGLVMLFGVIVAVAAYVAVDPSVDTGIASLTSQIASAFSTIAGL